MNEARPDPDRLLAQMQVEAARARRGPLRIFFGATAGVGKTYAMLEAAHAARARGEDVVVGYVQPHGRTATESLADGLESLPTIKVAYGDLQRAEFDLDAALRRRPATLLVDELAHSNLQGGDPPPRHAKRWQDIEELRDAGIGVWTTLNVQHLESLNDLVAQITGIRQRETLPDRIFDEADEVELIDLPTDDLLARLRDGKIYFGAEIATATERFFRRPNLLALRELALRRTTDRVEAAARASLGAETGGESGSRPWLARDRLLVAVAPDAHAPRIVRAGKRMAEALDAQWTVVYVETPALLKLSAVERNRRIDVLRLAESLGAETVTLDGPTAAEALLEYARTRQITRLLVGAPRRGGWRRWFGLSTVHSLVAGARDFDVMTLATPDVDGSASETRRATADVPAETRPVPWSRYAGAVATTIVATCLAWPLYPHVDLSNLVMIYLLGVTVAGLRLGRGPAVLTAVLNVLAFDLCYVPPRLTLAVSDAQYLLTFVVMLTIALVIATLMASVRQQTRVAGARERRTAALYAMSRELAGARSASAMARIAVSHVAETFQCRAVLLLPDSTGRLRYPGDAPSGAAYRGADLAVAQWVHDHGQRAGLGSDTLAAADGLYLPLGDAAPRLGVLAVLPLNVRRVLLPEQRHLLETFAAQLGSALERARLAESSETARVAAESESLRNTLLAGISHDLRTPLAVIAAAGSTLLERGELLEPAARISLARSIALKANEMSTLVSNVLDLVRLESGKVSLRRHAESVEDLIGAALGQLEGRLAQHLITVSVPPELAPIDVDAALMTQVFVNLIDNALKYTAPGTPIVLSAMQETDSARIVVEDAGPGLPGDSASRVFDKFQRGQNEGNVAGAGLGLAICRAIVHAHGGTIEAVARPGHGARFEIELPLARGAP